MAHRIATIRYHGASEIHKHVASNGCDIDVYQENNTIHLSYVDDTDTNKDVYIGVHLLKSLDLDWVDDEE